MNVANNLQAAKFSVISCRHFAKDLIYCLKQHLFRKTSELFSPIVGAFLKSPAGFNHIQSLRRVFISSTCTFKPRRCSSRLHFVALVGRRLCERRFIYHRLRPMTPFGEQTTAGSPGAWLNKTCLIVNRAWRATSWIQSSGKDGRIHTGFDLPSCTSVGLWENLHTHNSKIAHGKTRDAAGKVFEKYFFFSLSYLWKCVLWQLHWCEDVSFSWHIVDWLSSSRHLEVMDRVSENIFRRQAKRFFCQAAATQ